jgi:hypothetical protein
LDDRRAWLISFVGHRLQGEQQAAAAQPRGELAQDMRAVRIPRETAVAEWLVDPCSKGVRRRKWRRDAEGVAFSQWGSPVARSRHQLQTYVPFDYAARGVDVNMMAGDKIGRIVSATKVECTMCSRWEDGILRAAPRVRYELTLEYPGCPQAYLQ